MKEVMYRAFSADELKIDPRELSLRLKMPVGVTFESVEKCLVEVMGAVNCKASCARVSAELDGNNVTVGKIVCKSSDLGKNLRGCGEALIIAVTLGGGIDTLLRRKSAVSPAEHFICDAIASAVAESAADAAESFFKGDAKCRPRFSPGYGDLSLGVQKDVLEACNAQRLLGITLTDANLMLPTKSITAIIGRCD